jgi:hypothetical protein
MTGPYAFLSYAREDEQVVEQVARILELNGIDVWLDRSELHVGDVLKERLFQAVEAATWLVPVVSRNTSRSQWVFREYMQRISSRLPRRSKKKPDPSSAMGVLYPVLVTDPDDHSPREILSSSWFGDHLEPVVNAVVPRSCVNVSHLRGLISAMQMRWPSQADACVPFNDCVESKSRRLLWSTFPSRFQTLERRFHDLVRDSQTQVWVLVGLPGDGKSALVEWLQSRCERATRIDVASTRHGSLEERLEDVIVDVVMFDGIWGEARMLRVLSAVEQRHQRSKLLVITCTPNLLTMVEDRLKRIGARHAVDHERGVSLVETRDLVRAHSKDELFRKHVETIATTGDDRLGELSLSHDAAEQPEADSVTADVWADPTRTFEFLWRRIAASWLPFNPDALDGASFEHPLHAACRVGSEATGDVREHDCLSARFSTSLYEAEHRLQHFWQRDKFQPSGLPDLPQWKLDYIQRSFADGLSAAQQDIIRCVVRFGTGWTPSPEQVADVSLLERCFVIARRGQTFELSDRIFAQYFIPSLVIHHLSDLHVSVRAGKGLPAALACYRDEVLADVAKCPHLIIISGDIFGEVNSSTDASSIDPDPAIRGWFEEALALLRKKTHPFIPLPADKPRLFVVGGNQDVDPITEGSLGSPMFWAAARRRQSLRELLKGNVACHPYSEGLVVEAAASQAALAPKLATVVEVGPLQLALIDSCAYGSDETERQSVGSWLRFLYELVARSPQGSSSNAEAPAPLQDVLDRFTSREVSSTTATELLDNARTLALAAHCRSPRDFAQGVMRAIAELEPGYVSHATLNCLRELVHSRRQADDSVVRLAVLHHPIGSAPRDVASGVSELRNAGQVREVLANAHVAVALHGHLHTHWLEEVRHPLRSDWVLRALSAPALGGAHDGALGFNEVRIRWEAGAPRVLTRPMMRQAGAWVPGKGYEFTPGAHADAVVVNA